MKLITLTTDFGLTDEYVGLMKGVILGRAPEARIVDLSHAIPPGDIGRAARLISGAYPYFPEGTVHVVVVDPGVGGSRRIILLEAAGQLFLAPDNGIVSCLLQADLFEGAYEVCCRDLFLAPVSDTFHGRDIMAPVAARLARGLAAAAVGPPLTAAQLTAIQLPAPQADHRLRTVTGMVIAADHFGNLLTNIHRQELQRLPGKGGAEIVVRLRGVTIRGLQTSYDAVPAGGLLAIIGSRHYLEIAANRANAALLLTAVPGDEVVVASAPANGPDNHNFEE